MSSFASFPDFPLQDTLDGGLYRPDEHYLGGGADRLFFGHSASRPGVRYLISTSSDNGLDVELLRRELMPWVPSLFKPTFLGPFDTDGGDPVRNARRTAEVGFVEELPEGGPIARMVPDPRQHAAALGQQVGKILKGAVEANNVHVLGVRPEYVWVRTDGPTPTVTGVGGRNTAFFASASTNRDLPTARLFTRKYYAPEVSRGEAFDDRALVLTLAVMVAEWATGDYPYASDGAYGYWNLCAGRHRELPLDETFADLLSLGMRPVPGERPDLSTFIERLAAVASGQG